MSLPQQILALLSARPGMTLPEIAEALPAADPKAVRSVLGHLVTDGRVRKAGERRSYRYRAAPVVTLELSEGAHRWLAGLAEGSGRGIAAEAAEVIERAARA